MGASHGREGEQPILATLSPLCCVEAVLSLPPRFHQFLALVVGCEHAAVCHVPPRFLEFLAQGVGCDAAPAPSAVDAAAAAAAASRALHVLKAQRARDAPSDTTRIYTNLCGPL